MWDHLHATGGGDHIRSLCDQKREEGRRFVATLLFVHTSDGKHLERTTEVENFNVLVYDDPDALSLHGSPHSSLTET
jgi:hypothetical protein